MNDDDRYDELPDDEFMRELIGSLEADRPDPPEQLSDRTIRKVQAELTSRDLIDLTTFVFLMRFCAPLLDLLAAFFGHDPSALVDSRSSHSSHSSHSSQSPRSARDTHVDPDAGAERETELRTEDRRPRDE